MVCQIADGETVYVEVDGDRLIVSDRGDTCRYLEEGDGAHRRLDRDSVERALCHEGVVLMNVPDMWPHITVDPERVADVAAAVLLIGHAIEHVYAAGLKVRR